VNEPKTAAPTGRRRRAIVALAALAVGLSAAGFVVARRRGAGEPLRAYGVAAPRSLVGDAEQSPELATKDAWDAAAREGGDRPNIVMITLESVGANRVGYLGYPRDVTPNLDRIAAESLVLSRAYTTATHSNYAQMAILSSLFPRRGTTLDMYGRLDYPRFLMHDVAFGLGYTTATISSQDESWQGMLRFQTTETPTYYRHSPDFTGEHLDLISEDIAPDHETADAIVKWMHANQTKRFSLYVNFQSTHFPYPIPKDAPRPFVPDEPKKTFNFVDWDESELGTIQNRYDDALHYVDIQVGRIFDELEADGLLESTILVVTADHGENFFDHDIVTHGRTLFDTEARVPFLIHYPRMVAPERVDKAVSTLDAVPTIVDLMGLPPHPAHQGESVRWLGLPGAERHAAVFMNIQGWKHLDGIVCMPYKLVFDPEEKTTRLYDLERDPKEAHDVASDHPRVVSALRSVLFAQIEAQQRYHQNSDAGKARRAARFAPNMLPCPKL
jgi:arylsulfatase A-like enzyme